MKSILTRGLNNKNDGGKKMDEALSISLKIIFFGFLIAGVLYIILVLVYIENYKTNKNYCEFRDLKYLEDIIIKTDGFGYNICVSPEDVDYIKYCSGSFKDTKDTVKYNYCKGYLYKIQVVLTE
jgi:hypothetical protein